MPDQLKVYYRKEEINKGFVGCVLAGLLSLPQLAIFFPSGNILENSLPPLIQNLIFCGLLLFFVVLSLSILYAIFFLNFEDPILILEEDGMWVKHFGFVPWWNIDVIINYTYGTPIEILGISFKETSTIYKQASLTGKVYILFAKIFGSYHINFANLTIAHEEIISIASEYMKAHT